MAIGLFGSKGDAQRSSDSSDGNGEKTYTGNGEKTYPGDVEKGRTAGFDDDSDASITVGKQMELEAENAIKYRTCSWQKVCSILLGIEHGIKIVCNGTNKK
jgi:hypothetical protein